MNILQTLQKLQSV